MKTKKTGEGETINPAHQVQRMTKGHYRLLLKMGLKISGEPEPGEADEAWQKRVTEAMSAEERNLEGSAVMWLLTRPIADLMPGGAAKKAIDAGAWRDLVEAWEFEMDEDAVAELDRQLAEKAGRKA